MILKVLALRQFIRVPCIHFIHGSAKHIVIVQYVANRTITIQHPAMRYNTKVAHIRGFDVLMYGYLQMSMTEKTSCSYNV